MKLPKQSRTLHAAFTLVELLVVITIIAVLAGIALPVFNKVQERAKALEDANNLKQMGLATIAVASEMDGDLLVPPDGENAPANWAELLRQNHLKVNKVFHSPFDRRDPKDDIAAADAPLSYGANSQIAGQNRNMDDAKMPSQLILFAPALSSPMTFIGTFANPPTVSPANSAFGGTHQGGKRIKVVMLDGHVEDLQMNKFNGGDATELKNRWQFQDVTEEN